MKLAAILLAMALGLIILDSCKPAKRTLHRARETHRLQALRPR